MITENDKFYISEDIKNMSISDLRKEKERIIKELHSRHEDYKPLVLKR